MGPSLAKQHYVTVSFSALLFLPPILWHDRINFSKYKQMSCSLALHFNIYYIYNRERSSEHASAQCQNP